ncbi:phosphodiester glycosidase family protein [Saccharopolyspora sp. MS10]|uniref:phosphodiester glycosidase family protein n=1 Tax=Saccharopolyspora sp. MS10 TaxID=3385973 RepID=UPI00399F6DDC
MRSRGVVVVLAGAVLAGVVLAPAGAAAPLGPPPVEDAPGASAAERGPVSVRTATTRSVLDGFETSRETAELAPGLTLTEFDRFEPEGWVRGDVLTAELAGAGLRPAYLSPGAASSRRPLTEQLSGAVAGVNGDFFDIDASGAPLGAAISGGELLSAPAAGHNDVAAVGGSAGGLMRVLLAAELTRADGTRVPITDLNAPTIAPDGIGLYTPFWGAASRAGLVPGGVPAIEVELADDVVRQVRPGPAEGAVPAGAVRLLGVGSGADALRSLRPGDRASVHYRPLVDGPTPRVAVGGNRVLLRGGEVQDVDDTALHPRTAAGFSADGTRMWLVTIDGRQDASRGATERELAERLRALGASDAINLDGGGSSTLLAREPGAEAAEVHNSPSDGELRPVPNGIGFTTAAGSGLLRGIRVEPEAGTRVLSGLSRVLTARGHDETGAPVAAEPRWAVAPGGGRVENDVLRAGRPGPTTVTARAGGASGSTRIEVLGPPAGLSTDTERVALTGEGARGRFQVLGRDAAGFRTWVDPVDVRLEHDERAVRIVPDGDGFAVTALSPAATSVVTVRVGDLTTHLGVTTGSRPEPLASFDAPDGWRVSAFPAAVRASLSTAEGRAGTPGLALDYALTGTTTTRAAYVNAVDGIPLPPGTQRVGVWVNGDGRGAWLRGTVQDAAGVATVLDLARNVDWTGWRYVEAPLPEGISGSLRWQRLYAVEPDGARQYEGRLVFDDLVAQVAPEVPVPADPEPRDPVVVRDAAPPFPGEARIAVVSDAQFTADDPDGPLVAQARRSLREAVAAAPDALVINGDLVDRGTAADFDLAREVIESEVGGRLPWYYVPGNHEASGPGDLREFTAEFGSAHQVADIGGTRAIMLDSSTGSLLGGGFGQVRMLRSALHEAAADPGIRSVAIFVHHPLRDPGPGDASQLSDPKEARLLNRWLADFERDSGKPGVLVSGHVGAFHASTSDGIPLLVNGNAGKQPSAAPEQGGFTGWSLLRIDPGDRRMPVRWETRPHADRIELPVPPVAAGGAVFVRARLLQGDRAVPVEYPVTASWSGSGVHIGRGGAGAPGAVASFDPATGRLAGVRAGRAELSVTINGVKQSTVFTVAQK